ncbi:MAG: DegV family protein [Chloroflexota bacterium]
MSKAKVAVVTDSTSCLTPELIEKYNIHVIPLLVNWDEESLKDGIDITPDQFYSRLSKSSSMPATSQPSAGEFVELYEKVAESAESIVSIHISSELSGTYQSALAAQGMVEVPVELIDSRTTATPLGMMVIEAAKAVANGATAAEAGDAAKALIGNASIYFVVDTLEFLHRGGRIGGARRMIGSILNVKPILTIDDGKVESHASVRTKKKAMKAMIDTVTEKLGGKSPKYIGVIHSSAADEAAKLSSMMETQFGSAEVIEADLTPVIGTHVGPRCVGLAYSL